MQLRYTVATTTEVRPLPALRLVNEEADEGQRARRVAEAAAGRVGVAHRQEPPAGPELRGRGRQGGYVDLHAWRRDEWNPAVRAAGSSTGRPTR
jgi:hypothetical protein